MDDLPTRGDLPPVVAVYWAQPTDEGKARYVVEFGEDPAPGDIDVLNTIIHRHGGFYAAEVGPLPSQATVILNNPDADFTRLSWLKLQLGPAVQGTVIADMYVETSPVVVRLRALGDVQFDGEDPTRIAGLPGVASAQLVGDQVELVFDSEFSATADVAELCAVFMTQTEFVATVVPTLGTPSIV